MIYDTNSIERDIAGAKSALSSQLSEAEEKVRAVADWRTHYRTNPVPFLAGAVALGVVANALMGQSRRSGLRSVVNDAEGRSRIPLASSHVSNRTGHALEQLTDVLFAVGAAKLAKRVDTWLPGFHEEFSRRA